ncbi:ABC transporter-like, ATP-binding domain [Dillenia turbinata]|uniref:ABC transporter-like, ATP-binding domain n=1 Tax=Dillenia turbinata TaxID=194707 RepID=A0AAN8ZKF3_9MAGN
MASMKRLDLNALFLLLRLLCYCLLVFSQLGSVSGPDIAVASQDTNPVEYRLELMILCSVEGQKQRIAIARAILRDPPILILDKATSALDAESEHYIKEVVQALGHACEVRTILVMARRPTTSKICDGINVMDGGQIVADGSLQAADSKRWAMHTTE